MFSQIEICKYIRNGIFKNMSKSICILCTGIIVVCSVIFAKIWARVFASVLYWDHCSVCHTAGDNDQLDRWRGIPFFSFSCFHTNILLVLSYKYVFGVQLSIQHIKGACVKLVKQFMHLILPKKIVQCRVSRSLKSQLVGREDTSYINMWTALWRIKCYCHSYLKVKVR